MFGFINHNVSDLNKFVKCNICNGYLVDATTVIECMHSFCKTCIMKHLEDFNTCPTCKCKLHETKPYLDVRTDKVLQSIVYQLFPAVFRDEMRRRREFHVSLKDKQQLAQLSPEKRGDIVQDQYTGIEEDLISLMLTMRSSLDSDVDNEEVKPIYLLCPSILTVGHLVKFLSQKLSLLSSTSLTIFCLPHDELDHKYSLLDILCSYSHNRQRPLALHYCLSSPIINSSSNCKLVSLGAKDADDNLLFLTRHSSSRNKSHFLRNRIKPSLKAEIVSSTIV